MATHVLLRAPEEHEDQHYILAPCHILLALMFW